MNKDRTLFTIPINEINIKDIYDFCRFGVSESTIVEYKESLTDSVKEKIVKTIVSMANTDGGLILIGVKEGKGGGVNTVSGITDNDSKQIIVNLCSSHLQPAYCPEIQIIPMENGKVVLFIRINMDLVYSIPIFYREKGFFVRRDGCNLVATPDEIKLLFKKNEQAGEDYNKQPDYDLPVKHTGEFHWYSIKISFPIRRLSSQEKWIWKSDQIKQLKEDMENHKINDKRIWVKRFCPHTDKDYQIEISRNLECVRFSSYAIRTAIQPDGVQFMVCFYSRGHIVAFTGFPGDIKSTLKKEIIKEVSIAVYPILDLFTKLEMKKYYKYYLPEGERYDLEVQVNGCYPETTSVKSIEPEKITKEYIALFLASYGHMDYENDLEGLNIKSLIEIYNQD